MTKDYELDWCRLPLEGAHNVRELGGYPTATGGRTRYHRFLRADALGELSEADVAFLRGYGVRLVLDLRDESEAKEHPDVNLGEGVRVENVPLLAFDIADKAELEARFAKEPPTYEFFYEMILNNKAGLRRCFELIADAPEGCVVFHCAVGKDRTGILAMLLMALAGCDKWDCVANYVQTRANLMRHPWFVAYWNADDPRSAPLNDSPAHAMEHAWDVVQEAGGAVAFLEGCGVTYEALAQVRERLLA